MTFDPSDLPEGPFQDFHQYWQSLQTDEGIPRWPDFDPIAIPDLVPNLTIFEADLAHNEVGIRFVGTAIIAAQGWDTTGQQLSKMENMAAIEERCLNAARTQSPYFLNDMPVTWTSNDFKTYGTLGLPLRGATGDDIKIVYLMLFD